MDRKIKTHSDRKTSDDRGVPPPGKILALDVGEKTIGCAVVGSDGIAPEPLPAILRRDGALSLGALRRLITAHRVHTLVIGIPLVQGKATLQSRKTGGFIAKIRKHFPELNIVTVDETLTTWSAKKNFSHRHLKKYQEPPASNLDSFAAREILITYIETRDRDAKNHNPEKHLDGPS